MEEAWTSTPGVESQNVIYQDFSQDTLENVYPMWLWKALALTQELKD